MELPPLHNLGLCPPCAPTGPQVPPGAQPQEDDTCAICLESLAGHIGNAQAPGEALRPAAPTWVRVCASDHAVHKVCIRTFLLKSAANRGCPECRQPVLRADELQHIPDGSGSMMYVDGVKYDGQFQNGEPNGQGTMTYQRGGVYVGQFRDGLQHGQGTMTSATRGKYVGEWQDGAPHGQGTMTYTDGSSYAGQFQNGKRGGQGTMTSADGGVYVGQFQNGLRNGQGTMTYADGITYVGAWRDGKPHGQGEWRDGGRVRVAA